jgi:outer membrane lipoprotein SlyB
VLNINALQELPMQAVTGIFPSQAQAERAVTSLKSHGTESDKITLLTPGSKADAQPVSVETDAAEQPGIGKALGAVVGAATGLSGAALVAIIPGVGPVTALGLLGAAVLTAAGAGVGAVAGESLDNSLSRGLPEDELFVYEDALRRGHSVVIVLAEDGSSADEAHKVLAAAGAEAIDAARDQWWIGLRSAEQEHYSDSGHHFGNDEKFYRMGFEAAQHARTRCLEFDQVSAEMANRVEELERQYPDLEVEEPFTRGYQRGREYYQRLCDESKAA